MTIELPDPEKTEMQADLELNLPATLHGLTEGLIQIDRHCAAHMISAATVARLRVIVEELYSNTIKYGYGGECDRPVRMKLSLGAGATLIYEDDAPFFDPTAWNTQAVLDLPPDERDIGQTGIALVLGMAAKVTHAALTCGNRLILSLT